MLLGFALALCVPFLGAPVLLDDGPYVFGSRFLRAPSAVFWSLLLSPSYLAATAERTWQPAVTVINRMFVDAPLMLRALSVLLHALCAFLVFRLAESRRAAWFSALLFLSFPLSAETVFFASAKGHLLAAAAVLLCVLTGSWVPFVAGLACKESVLAALPLLFLRSWLVEGRSAAASLRRLAPFGLIAAAYLLWRFAVLAPPPPLLVPSEPKPFSALAWSLGALVWTPAPGFFRAFPAGDAWVLLVLAPYAAALWHWRGDKRTLYRLLWVSAALLPFLHLVPFAAKSPVADRYLYLAAAGAALLVGGLADARSPRAAAALIVLWSFGFVRRAVLYREPLAFAQAGVDSAPGSAAANLYLSQVRLERGDAAGSAEAAARAARLEPRDPENWSWLGLASVAAKDAPAAEAAFLKALSLQETPQARANLGAFYEETERPALALKEYERASELAPDWEKPRRLAAELRARRSRRGEKPSKTPSERSS